jgi:hypothetical protein
MSAKSSTSVAPQEGDPSDLRANFRWQFKGTALPCRMGKKKFELRLKDLSRGGACGLVDEPFAVGDYFFAEIDPNNVVEAQVIWTRRVMIGVRFNRLLTATLVTKFHERAAEEAAEREREALEALRAVKGRRH